MPKISVHLEADSAEEFQALLAAFHVTHVKPPVATVAPETLPWHPAEAPKVEAVTEPVTVAEAPAEKPVEAKKRGRPAKAKPVDEAPVAAPVEAAAQVRPLPPEISIKPPVGPAPTIKAPKPEPVEALSRQDLLDVFAEYVQRYGANFGYTDISTLLQQNLGDGVRKASDVPEEALPVAIGAIRTAIQDNPFNRKRDYA